jgi:hypothetical protein
MADSSSPHPKKIHKKGEKRKEKKRTNIHTSLSLQSRKSISGFSVCPQ